jgi:hypothetical protein
MCMTLPPFVYMRSAATTALCLLLRAYYAGKAPHASTFRVVNKLLACIQATVSR